MHHSITEIDTRGLKCPLPVLKLEKAISSLPSGARIVVLATDPVARIDIPHLCNTRGYAHSVRQNGTELRFEIVLT